MTISTTASSVTIAGNGTTTSFNFSFIAGVPSNVSVTYTDATGSVMVLTQGSQYTLTLNAAAAGQIWGVGGSVIYPLSGSPIATGTYLTISRIVPFTQLTSISNQGDFYPQAVEQAMDTLEMQIQQVESQAARAIQFNPTDPLYPPLPPAASRSGLILGFSPTGAVELLPPSSAPWQAPFVSVTPYGAKGDGVTDDTQAIQNALNSGQDVFFPWPQNFYLVSNTLTANSPNQTIFGASAGASLIQTNSTTGDLLVVSASGVTIYGLGFGATVTRTSGSFINIQNVSYTTIQDFYMTAFFNGVTIGLPGANAGGVCKISRGRLVLGTTSTSAGFVVNSGVDIVLRDHWIVGSSAAQLGAGVLVRGCGDLTLDHVSTVYAGNGLAIAPAAGSIVQALFANDCFFDSGSGGGIVVESAGTVQLLKIHNSWSATNASGGVILNTSGSGTVQQVDILNSVLSNNTTNGVLINTTGVTFINMIGCSMSANLDNGILVESSENWFKIIGCTIGLSGEFSGNFQYGISIAAGDNNFIIRDNFINSNGIGSISLGTPAGGYGITWFIGGNVGYVTQGSGLLTTTAGPATFTVSHGLANPPNPQDIVTNPASALGTATSYYVNNLTATTFDVVFNTAPGAGVLISWSARILGA